MYPQGPNNVNPTLTSWRKTSRGHIKGIVYGHPQRKDGARIIVTPASIISNKIVLEGYLLSTLGTHNYRLGTSESTECKVQRLEDIAKVAAVKAEREENVAEHEAFLSKMANLAEIMKLPVAPVEAATGNHDDEDNVPASMVQLHHNFSIIHQAFDDVVRTPTKPTTNIKVGTLVNPEDDDDSISRPILPAKYAI